MTSPSDRTPALSLENIVKTFPGVRALDGVSFDVLPGETHALLGENGAGKSTLMKVLAGIYQPDEGRILIEGRPVIMRSPLEAKRRGVVLIHQELSLADNLSVAENIYLGELPHRSFGRVDWNVLNERVRAILNWLRCRFDPTTRVGDLSVANCQMVEIARALTVNARAVIFDEPTASLTDTEKVVLFDIISELQEHSVGVVYISHRMDEVFALADRITVLRDGGHRGTLDAKATNEEEVIQLMIGRKLEHKRAAGSGLVGEPALEVRGLSCGKLFSDVSFSVSAGEVLGFYGLIGSGRTEIAQTLFGLRRPTSGGIFIHGQAVQFKSPTDAIKEGIALVPESRKDQGLVLGMNCRDNLTLPQIGALTIGPFVAESAQIELFDRYRKLLKIKAPSWRQVVMNLSGGNQQKVVIGKWLAMQPKILIVDEPTRGIDVGSKAEIHGLIRQLAASGYAIIVISSEMPEVLQVSDRVVAIYRGRIIREFSSEEVTEDKLVQAISGMKQVAEI